MEQLTKEQAIELAQSGKWKDWPDRELVGFQLFQERLCMDFSFFHEKIEKVLNRPSDVDIYKRESLWGQIDYWTRTIRVYANDRTLEDIFETIIHEVIHGIEAELHLKAFKKDDGHNELSILAVALSDVLTRNGWVNLANKAH